MNTKLECHIYYATVRASYLDERTISLRVDVQDGGFVVAFLAPEAAEATLAQLQSAVDRAKRVNAALAA
jgi:hypothetical protein